jgi:PhnB protein
MPPSSSRPAGAPQVLPYLYYPDAAQALAFLVDTFGFTEIQALRDEQGQVFTAQVSTGDGVVLMGPEMADFGTRAVADPAWVNSRTFVYVDDVDGHYERARAAGATIVTQPTELGPNRIYIASDCGGQQWIFATPLT